MHFYNSVRRAPSAIIIANPYSSTLHGFGLIHLFISCGNVKHIFRYRQPASFINITVISLEIAIMLIAKAFHITSAVKILAPVNIAAKSFCHSAVRSSINLTLLKSDDGLNSMCIALVHQVCGCCIIFLKAFYQGEMFSRYHNIRYQHRLRGPPGRF